jgi:zinc protease
MLQISQKSITCLVASSLLIGNVLAQTAADIIPIDKMVTVGKLPNGLTYYVRKNSKPENKVELRLAVNAGSVLERDDQQGVAHFLEHMAFNGTKNFPKNELTNYLQKSGVRFGADLNASTGFDETVYMLPIASNDAQVLNNGFQVIRDWAGNLLLEMSEIDKERGIILEEKRMRQGAYMRMFSQYLPSLLNGSKYAQRIPIGKEEIITTAKRKAFTDFYNDWYRPNNMAVIVVGDIDVVATIAKIKTLFGDLKNPANAPVRNKIIPINWHTQDKAAVVTDKENTNNSLEIYLGVYKADEKNTWSSYKKSTINQLVSSMVNNRLQEYSLQPKSAIGGANLSLDNSEFRNWTGINISAMVKDNVPAALNTVMSEILSAKKFGFSLAELDRAKKEVIENMEQMAAEKDKTESGRLAREYVSNFLDKEPSPGILAEADFVKKTFATLTLETINKQMAAVNIDKPAFVLFTANESNKNLPTETALLDAYKKSKLQVVTAHVEKEISKELLETMPMAGKINTIESNADFATKIYNLSNGIKVICKKTEFKNDEVLLGGFQWGGNSNLSDKEVQLSKFFMIVNELGLGTHTSSELQKMLSGVNATVSISSTANNVALKGKSSVKDFEKLMQILHLKLTNVNFNEDEIEGIKNTLNQQFGMIKNNPSFKFMDSANRFKYNFSARYASPFPDAIELEKLSSNDLKEVYKKITSNLNGTTLVLVGNIDEATIATMLEKYIASIPTKSEKVAVNTANIIRPITGNNSFTMKGGKEKKSEINLSYYGNLANFDDKENLAYGLLADILQMKATEKLREEMGGTYSPSVRGQMTRQPLLEYSMSLIVPSAPENVDKLSTAFAEIITKVIGGSITDDDMLKAKEQRKKTMETQMKTNGYWASIIENQDMYGYNANLISTYFTRLIDVTKEEIVAVAKKYLSASSILKSVMNPE